VAAAESLINLLGSGPEPEQLVQVRELPSRAAVHEPWPDWVHPDVLDAYASLGVHTP